MAVIVDPDSLVASVGLYKGRHWLTHGYAWPFFVVLYPIWAWIALIGKQ